jgi:anti-sigma factor ChrR (cupin superfamily)
VKQELLARIADELPKSDQQIKRAGSGDWRPTGLAGIAIRRLSVDRTLRREMFLLKIEPGATLPDHRHSQAEECYVIEGSLRTRGVLLRAGDFIKLDAGSQHGVTTTDDGCVVLIAAGLAEEG